MAYNKVNWNTLSTIPQEELAKMDDGIFTLDQRLSTELARLPNISNIHIGYYSYRGQISTSNKTTITVSDTNVKSNSFVFAQVVSVGAIYANPVNITNGQFQIVLKSIDTNYNYSDGAGLRINYLIVNSGS